jgi:hypothetical protein
VRKFKSFAFPHYFRFPILKALQFTIALAAAGWFEKKLRTQCDTAPLIAVLFG